MTCRDVLSPVVGPSSARRGWTGRVGRTGVGRGRVQADRFGTAGFGTAGFGRGRVQADRPKASRWPSLVPTNSRPPSVAGTENLVTVPSAKLRRSLSAPLTGTAS